LGVLIPAAESAIEKTMNKKIAVIATEGTVSSGAFIRELKKLDPKVEVLQKTAPLLVSIVESGEQNSAISRLALNNYLTPLIKKGVDTIILGCTHYGIIQDEIRAITGKVALIAEGKVAAKKLKDYLCRHPEIEKKLSQNKKIKFLSTDRSEKFQKLGSVFFGRTIRPQRITLR